MSLQTKITNLRNNLGISINELSRQTGISKSYLCKLESEPSNPSKIKMHVIEEALGARYGYLDDDSDQSDGTDSKLLADSIDSLSDDDRIRVKQIVKLWSEK